MKTNSKMKQYLDSLVMIDRNNFTIDFKSLESVIFPEFIEWDGCVLLSQENNNELPAHFIPNEFVPDRTAFEADYNHIHLNDIFDEGIHSDAILDIGTKILHAWMAVLYKKYNGHKKFILILNYDGEEVVLRFYSVRENEVPWLNISKLESYLDGIMILEM